MEKFDYFGDLTVDAFHRRRFRRGIDSGPLLRPWNFSLEYIESGAVTLWRDGRPRELNAPVLFWMAPGHLYRFFDTPSSGEIRRYEHIWVDIHGPRAERMIAALDRKFPAGYVESVHPEEIGALFLKIAEARRVPGVAGTAGVAVALEEIMRNILLSVEAPTASGGNVSDRLAELALRIETKPFDRYDVEKLGAELRLSAAHLRFLFRRYCGEPLYAFILRRRMNHAAELLAERKYSVKEVAGLCGYDELPAFSRTFKRLYDIAPSHFKNNCNPKS